MVDNDSYYGNSGQREMFNNYEQLVMDVAGPALGNYIEQEDTMTEDPNPQASQFFNLLKAANSPLWDGCDSHSMLSASLKALSLKADYGLSEGCFNEWMQFMADALPDGNSMPKNLYHAKKSVAELGLACMKIECCPGGCMLYYKEDEMLQSCKFCPEKRYKEVKKQGKVKLVPQKKMWYFPLVPRLQRLYSSMQTASQMRWHREHHKEPDFLSHPADAEAWMRFDETWKSFAQDPKCKIRLML